MQTRNSSKHKKIFSILNSFNKQTVLQNKKKRDLKVSPFDCELSSKSKRERTKNVKKISKNKWTKVQKLQLLILVVISKIDSSLQVSEFSHLIPNTNEIRLKNHISRFRKIYKKFSDIFFNYYDVSYLNLSMANLKESMKIVRNSILERGFFNFFLNNEYDAKCHQYFQSLYSFRIFETIGFIENYEVISIESSSSLIDSSVDFKKAQSEELFSFNMKEPSSNLSAEKHNPKSNCIPIKKNIKISNFSNFKKQSPEKLLDSVNSGKDSLNSIYSNLKNIKIQVDEEYLSGMIDFYNKYYNVANKESNEVTNIILDEEFLFQYLSSQSEAS